MAFGDSLTRGYYNNGKNHHPYTMKLQYLLNKMDAKRCFIVQNEGRDGDIAFGEMPKRMEEVLTNISKYILNPRGIKDVQCNYIFNLIIASSKLFNIHGIDIFQLILPTIQFRWAQFLVWSLSSGGTNSDILIFFQTVILVTFKRGQK